MYELMIIGGGPAGLAAGEGAKAALQAHRYLQRLTA